jgi:hypothetical protein
VPEPEIRDDVIDLATNRFPQELTPSERDLLATMTVAERELADRLLLEQAESHRRVMAAAYRDPESVADEIALLNDSEPDMSFYDGLPVTAPEFCCLQLVRPWPPVEAARAAQISSAWTPADRELFEERFAAEIPGGIHWPG